MVHAVAVTPEGHYRLRIRFDDGVEGLVDLTHLLRGPVFEPLEDPGFFNQVFVDEFGAVAWPGGQIDMCPDWLYMQVQSPAAA